MADLILLAADWPAIVFPTLFAGGTLALCGMWWRSRSGRAQIKKDLDEFKDRVVRCNDTMDALRGRHQQLPLLDPDFKAPMSGQTLAEYTAIEGLLEQYRDRWLEVMDIWDQVQATVEGKDGGDGSLKTAAGLLEQNTPLPRLTALETECTQRLDQLESAHERARDALESVDDATASLAELLSDLSVRELDEDTYQTDLDEIASLTDEGRRTLTPDPVGAFDVLQQATDRIDQTSRRVESVLHALDELQTLLAEPLTEQQERVHSLREAGYLFAEPDVAPLPLFESVERRINLIRAALDRGAHEDAARHLDDARSLLQQGVDAIETCLRMRDNSPRLIADARMSLRRLLDDAKAAELQRQQLMTGYPEDAWRAVGDNLETAREMVTSMETLIDQAEQAVADDRQHYMRGRLLLEEVTGEVDSVSRLIDAVAARRRELDEQRDRSQQSIESIQREADRLARTLQHSEADRDLCNNRFNMARDRLSQVLDRTRENIVDWPWIARKAEECAADFRRVEDLFQQDLQLRQQAESEIREAERALRNVRGFYRNGISADVGAADQTLTEAGTALRSQDYESAVRLANQAEQAARDARADAERRTAVRERELDRARRTTRNSQMESLAYIAGAAAARTITKLSR